MAAGHPETRPWLIGPVPDLLLGCGVLYMGIFVAFTAAGDELRGLAPAALMVFLALVLSAPHYGGTLLRVYDQRHDRKRYALFSIHATWVVVLAFFVGLHSVAVGSWLLTIFLVWSPWHYTGQNYGLAVMFLRRRGVPLDPVTKRVLYVSFILSYVLLALVLFAGDDASSTARAYGAAGGEKLQIQTLGVPAIVQTVGVPTVAVAYFAALGLAAFRLLKRASARALLPTALLSLTQALWFSVPMLVRYGGVPLGIEPLDAEFRTYSFGWIALGHAVQYLWVTTYYARGSPGWQGTWHYLGKTLLVGTALWTLPLVLFAPSALGGVFGGGLSGDAGFYLLLSSCINIHHFILDGAIWKLRDTRIASVLLRDVPLADSDRSTSTGTWPRRVVWGVAAAGAVLSLVHFDLEARLLRGGEANDLEVASAALDGLARFGQDSAGDRRRIAKAWIDRGDLDLAQRELRRSLALEPTATGYGELALLEERRGDRAAVARALAEALRLEPDHPGLLRRAAAAELTRGRRDGR